MTIIGRQVTSAPIIEVGPVGSAFFLVISVPAAALLRHLERRCGRAS